MEAFGIVLPVEYLVESNPVRPRKESLLLRFYSNTMRFYIASINGRGFTDAHRELMHQTERALAQPTLLAYRMHRLDLLCRERDGGSDC